MKRNLKEQLQSLLRVEAAMLTAWYEAQIANAELVASDPEIRKAVYDLLEAKKTINGPTDHLDQGEELTKLMRPAMSSHDYLGFFVADQERSIVASSHKPLLGMSNIAQYEPFLKPAIEGTSVVSNPIASIVMMKDRTGVERSGVPTMFVATPIRDSNFHPIGAMVLRVDPEDRFTKILQLGQLGKSGETYAINRDGVFLSNSRFDNELILAGLLPDQPDSKSILQLQSRDPGGDMTRSFRPKVRRSELPLTKMAIAVTKGEDGIDVSGYNDYRGVPVVGAWTWLTKHDVGLATEIDAAEAFGPLYILQRTFWTLYGLLVASSIAIFIFTLVVSRLRREAQKAAIESQELGQYRLESKLGAGAMGVVYKGYHAMMRRPTAIKLLNVDGMNANSIERFEREVQITSQLNHPNTIAIYDYGRTPEGVFYYAMEFLDGINLQSLVEQYGPQPESRVIQMLLQICGSLYEAHSQGLVHRDIKPANIMLNRRGAQPDVVKVLDFGLVKDIHRDKQSAVEDKGLSGTPLYLSPEAIQSPNLIDACSDLYAVGAVGYFLLTGQTVFDATSVVDLLQKHITDQPIPPSQVPGTQVSGELEHVILSCLEKSRARRPQTARELAAFLSRCIQQSPWTLADADAWWSQHERRMQGSIATPTSNNASIDQGRSDSKSQSGFPPPTGASEAKPTTNSSDPLAQTFFVDE